MLVQTGFNTWKTRKARCKEECFDWKGHGRLQLKAPYKRTFWDWLAGRRRVPVTVAEEMLKTGDITEYTPVPTLSIALVSCKKVYWAIYMDYS